jgi:hypothetical protein
MITAVAVADDEAAFANMMTISTWSTTRPRAASVSCFRRKDLLVRRNAAASNVLLVIDVVKRLSIIHRRPMMTVTTTPIPISINSIFNSNDKN